jgi:hypothetical protein
MKEMRMRVSALVRVVVVALAAVAVSTAAACSGSGSDQNATPTVGATAVSAPTDEPGYGENPCASLTADDVRSALGQTVSDTQRYETTSDDTATVQRCALVTDGKPLAGTAFTNLSALATGFTGGDLPGHQAAAVGVILVTRTAPFNAADGDTSKFPAGSTTITGVGTFAVVLASPTGGVGFAQTSPTVLVVVYDAEDRAVPESQMEALLRAAAAKR